MSLQSHHIGPAIADSARLSLGYARRMLTDVPANQFARFATLGDKQIISNHPAFVYGHLSIYPCRIIEQLGGDATAYKPTAQYDELFNAKATCVDDPSGTIYPPMPEIVERMLTNYEKAMEVIQAADDELFLQPNANEAMRAKFSTNGSMHAFYVGGHVMLHLGQVSAWRRMMGLGPGLTCMSRLDSCWPGCHQVVV